MYVFMYGPMTVCCQTDSFAGFNQFWTFVRSPDTYISFMSVTGFAVFQSGFACSLVTVNVLFWVL